MRRYSWFLLLLPVAACSERAAEVPLPEVTVCEVEGMRNCALAGDLLIGGQPSEAALQQLAAQGYRTVVSTRGEGEIAWDERAVVESLGLEFVSIPMASPVTEITDDQVAKLDEVLRNASGPTVLHCGSGNRVSGLWAAWLVERGGIDPEAALQLAEETGMTGVRPVVEQRLAVEGRR